MMIEGGDDGGRYRKKWLSSIKYSVIPKEHKRKQEEEDGWGRENFEIYVLSWLLLPAHNGRKILY